MSWQRDKFPPIPTKFAPGLAKTEGEMFHTITYGKGLMGSHASQLNKEERWKLVHFIRTQFMEEVPANIAPTTVAVEVVEEEAETVEVVEEVKITETHGH